MSEHTDEEWEQKLRDAQMPCVVSDSGQSAGSVKDALDTIWNDLERISTEENHTATNIEARKNLRYLEWFFENRPNV